VCVFFFFFFLLRDNFLGSIISSLLHHFGENLPRDINRIIIITRDDVLQAHFLSAVHATEIST
jgi:hypothetical protein